MGSRPITYRSPCDREHRRKLRASGSWRDLAKRWLDGNYNALEYHSNELDNLDWLHLVPGLRYFSCVGPIRDDRGIVSCPHLRGLGLDTDRSRKYDLAPFSELENLYFPDSRVKSGLESLTRLVRLSLSGIRSRDLSRLSAMTELCDLVLLSARGLISLEGLRPSKLQKLSIYEVRGVIDMSALDGAVNLRDVRLDHVKHLEDLEWVRGLTAVEELELIGCGPVASLEPLAGMHRLRHLYLGPGTEVRDGDLSVLEGMDSLEDLWFTEKKHYNRRRIDIPSGAATLARIKRDEVRLGLRN